ncbi:flavin reductase family protein [Arthrobacter crystallopoietes]|uniref:flavin reductase family protein n=1 Tax=Crystallibacter crystallopoietes TaxID=37928 RepID=UPI00111147D8|nr:flavin reductase family protein [Arthrobacter crystallopoietes]
MTTTATTKRRHVDQSIFRNTIGHFTSGVAVITTQRAGERFGVTASAISSLSMDPPMLLVCLNRKLATADAISGSGAFAVNILAEDQSGLATQFATRHPDKFRGVPVTDSEVGVPILAGALAHLECRVMKRSDVATHTVFIAEVQEAKANPGSPLVYFRGQFGRFS